MTAHANIHEAINAVMAEVGYVKKQRTSGLNYSFAGEAALIEALRPAMVEHGIYMCVSKIHSIDRERYATAKGTEMLNTVIRAAVQFIHTSGSILEVEACGEGADSGDKSANKAMTGLYKYALRQTFCIETGDDPDKYASEERLSGNGHKPATKEQAAVERQRTELQPGLTPPTPAETLAGTPKMIKPMNSDQVAWAALQWGSDKSVAAKKINALHLPNLMEEAEFKKTIIAIKEGEA